MAAFHLKGFERFLALKGAHKATRTKTAEAKPRSAAPRSASRRRK